MLFLWLLSTFSIVPIRFRHVKWDDSALRYFLMLYPFIGLLLGCIWAGICWALQLAHVSVWIGGSLLLAVPHVFSGFLHLDGFMDVMDAALSHRNREEKLRILKDSHTGAFAVISLGVLFLITFGGMSAFYEQGKSPWLLLLIPVISRSLSGLLLLCGKTFHTSSMGSYFRTGAGKSQVAALILICAAAAVLSCCMGIPGICSAAGQLAAFGIMTWICYRQFGGISGDVAGCCLVVCEGAGIWMAAIG